MDEIEKELLRKTVEDRLIDRVNQAYNLAMNIYETNKKTKTEIIKFYNKIYIYYCIYIYYISIFNLCYFSISTF